MTGIQPFPVPHLGVNGVVQDPGMAGAFGYGVAQVLAAIQQQKENEFRQQQLQTLAAQQQSLDQYYQGQVGFENRKLDVEQGNLGAIGGGLQQMMGGGAPAGADVKYRSPTPPGQVPLQRGNMTAGMAPAPPPPQPQLGNMTQQQGMSSVATMNPETDSVGRQVMTGASVTLSPDGTDSALGQILGHMPPQAVPGFIEQLNNLRNLQKPLESTPDLQQNFAWGQSLPEPYKGQFMKLLERQGGGNHVTVSTGDKANLAGAEQDQKNQADMLKEAETNARTQTALFPAYKQSFNLVDKSYAGMMAKPTLALARIGAAWGVVDPDKVANTQELMKLTGDQVLNFLRGRELGAGNAVSNKDLDFIEQNVAKDISLTPQGMKAIFRVNYGGGLYKMKMAMEQLRGFAADNPVQAKSALRRAGEIERQMKASMYDYTRMMMDEGRLTPSEIEEHIRGLPGASEALSRVLQEYTKRANTAQSTADSIGWQGPQ